MSLIKALLLALSGVLLTSLLSPPTQQSPVFRSGVEQVAVDFVALDKEGNPVKDLGKDELVLRVDGRNRTIRSLRFLDLPTFTESGVFFSSEANNAIDSFPNARTVLLVFDQESLRAGDEHLVVKAALSFLDKLAPRDRVAISMIPRGAASVRLTTDREESARVLSTFAGHGESVRDECEAGHLTRALLRSLKTMLNGLEATESPVVVILVSAGLLQPESAVDRVTRQSPCIGMRPDRRDYADVGKAAARLRGQFYVIQPHTFTTVASERQARDSRPLDEQLRGLEDLVAIAGGQLFRPSGSPTAAFDRIARESSGYYLLGFESEPPERDGKRHRIDVRASRPNVRIRARPEFTIEKQGS